LQYRNQPRARGRLGAVVLQWLRGRS